MASLLNGIAPKATAEASRGRGRDEVYVAAVALRATKGPAQLLMSAAYSVGLWDLQHFLVIIKPNPPPQSHQAVAFDFQPQEPENIYVAIQALSGGRIPGTVLMRKLKKMPKSKCWFVGSLEGDAVDAACKFSSVWDTYLTIGHHDCRDYTNALVEHLSGEKDVLQQLSRHKQRFGNGSISPFK